MCRLGCCECYPSVSEQASASRGQLEVDKREAKQVTRTLTSTLSADSACACCCCPSYATTHTEVPADQRQLYLSLVLLLVSLAFPTSTTPSKVVRSHRRGNWMQRCSLCMCVNFSSHHRQGETPTRSTACGGMRCTLTDTDSPSSPGHKDDLHRSRQRRRRIKQRDPTRTRRSRSW